MVSFTDSNLCFVVFFFSKQTHLRNKLARVGSTLYLSSLWLYKYILIWTVNLGSTECICTEPVWYMYDHHWIRIWRFDQFLTTNCNYFFCELFIYHYLIWYMNGFIQIFHSCCLFQWENSFLGFLLVLCNAANIFE